MSIFIGQQPVVLRLPLDLADMVSNHLNNTNPLSNPNIAASSPSSSSLVLTAEVHVENLKKNYFYLSLNDKNFPAMLVDLPTKLETHKLFENSKLFKSTDIGQMLQVFKTLEERDECRKKIYKFVNKGFKCSSSGISPPMKHVVNKKWLPTRSHGPYSKLKTAYVMEEIRTTQTGLQSDRDVVTIEEEVVDFEDWMVGGTTIKGGRVVPVGVHITITSEAGSDIENHSLLLEHPEIFEQEWDSRDDDLLLGVDDARDTLLPGYLELMDDVGGDSIDDAEKEQERTLRLRLYSNNNDNNNNLGHSISHNYNRDGLDDEDSTAADEEDEQIERITLRKLNSTGDFSVNNTDNTDPLDDDLAFGSDDGNEDEEAVTMDVDETSDEIVHDNDNSNNKKVKFDSNDDLSQSQLQLQSQSMHEHEIPDDHEDNDSDGNVVNLMEDGDTEDRGEIEGKGNEDVALGIIATDSNDNEDDNEDDSSDDDDGDSDDDNDGDDLLAAMEQELADGDGADDPTNTTVVVDGDDDDDDDDDDWLGELEEDDLERLASSPVPIVEEPQVQGELEEPYDGQER